MKNDGTDVYPISWHETTELLPVVNNDGMLVFTRWDYVDRCFHQAHHIWISTPDGCDPRAPHGNYPFPHSTIPGIEPVANSDGRSMRPWAEYGIRSIPNSAKYIAVAGWHHGAYGGEPVILDISVRDDDKMAQVKTIRPGCCILHEAYLTDPKDVYQPKVACPSGCSDSCQMLYCPWALSEDYYLFGTGGKDDPTQIILLDKFGNRELVYSAAVEKHGTFGPADEPKVQFIFPLRARPKPNTIPARTFQGERASLAEHKRATISVVDVKQADFTWPTGTVIKALRIIQPLCKPGTSPKLDVPMMGYGSGDGNTSGAQGRMALGTVPVESDGSAYFEAPVGKEIYFQAIDDKGMAVQSMRSGTFVHPGEQLTCVGCHEDKWNAVPAAGTRVAFTRAPSQITPDVDGACPMTFARLVQPTFQSKCIPCHQQNGKDIDLSCGGLKDRAFYFNSFDRYFETEHGGSRTIAGRFGARESPLGKTLLQSHLAARITQEELHRVTLWLDCNSMELAAYKEEEAQRNGQVVWPEIDVDPANPIGTEKDHDLPGLPTNVARESGARPVAAGVAVPRISVSSNRIHVAAPNGEPMHLAVIDVTGRTVMTRLGAETEVILPDGIRGGRLAAGLYFVSVRTPLSLSVTTVTIRN
jgi:hypothetical protein